MIDSLEDRKSYGQILRSTTLIGGSQIINIFLGIIRTKFLALLLGPIGVGLMGVYNSLTQLIVTVSGLGIGSSAVREVASASSSGDQGKINRTIITIRRLSLFLGVLGMSITAILSGLLSKVSFGTRNYQVDIAVLSIVIYFSIITASQTALLQGLRRIGDIAALSVLGSLFGTIFSIPIIYLWRQKGIIPFLIMISLMNLFASWWYARRISISNQTMKLREVLIEGKGLLSLGLAFMGSGLVTQGTSYLIRIILLRQLGLDGLGLYQAAFTLSSIYIGVILTAMGLDYYPRLTAVSDSNAACNLLINQQTEVGLLVAAPGIIATLSFAPFILEVFYSTKFIGAYGILRWSIIGVFLRVISWPLGYLLLAKGKAKLFFITELAANVAHLIFIWIGTKILGLNGAGVAFFGLYVFYSLMILIVSYHLTRFVLSANNVRLIVFILLIIAFSILSSLYLPKIIALTIGVFITTLIGFYCFKRLYALVGREWFSSILIKLSRRFNCIRDICKGKNEL